MKILSLRMPCQQLHTKDQWMSRYSPRTTHTQLFVFPSLIVRPTASNNRDISSGGKEAAYKLRPQCLCCIFPVPLSPAANKD